MGTLFYENFPEKVVTINYISILLLEIKTFENIDLSASYQKENEWDVIQKNFIGSIFLVLEITIVILETLGDLFFLRNSIYQDFDTFSKLINLQIAF